MSERGKIARAVYDASGGILSTDNGEKIDWSRLDREHSVNHARAQIWSYKIADAALAALPAPDAQTVERLREAPDDTALLGMVEALRFIDFVNLWMNRDNVTDAERVSVIKHHPIARRRALALTAAAQPVRQPSILTECRENRACQHITCVCDVDPSDPAALTAAERGRQS